MAAGNAKLMERLGIAYKSCSHVGTVVHMAVDGRYAGHILISDTMKPHAKQAIKELKKCGVKKTIMLTGDRKMWQIMWQRSGNSGGLQRAASGG